MSNTNDKLHESVIDAYLADSPDLRLADENEGPEQTGRRYSRRDCDALVKSILEADADSHRQVRQKAQAVQRTLGLFDEVDDVSNAPSAKPCPSAFFDAVIRSYLAVYNGFSIDRLIADRERNALFVSECWKRGVQASSRELNWSLLNARKANRIGPVDGVARFRMPTHQMYQFLYASEIALRKVQDSEWVNSGRQVSLDYILCDSHFSDRFENIAKQLAPGYSVFEYRWAAMCIRKNQRRSVKSRMPRFKDYGPTVDLRVSQLPRHMGFYWFQAGDKPLYVGHAENLRAQIDRILQQGGAKSVFPQGLLEEATQPMHLAVASTNVTALSKRETLKSEVCLTQSPLFNVRNTAGSPSPSNKLSHNKRCA